MIGIAVPCHKNHAYNILPLLENISKSTVLPAQVVISCSSWTMDMECSFLYKSIPVTVIYTPYELNASQNRNIAAKRLQTEYISFFDVDDRMHPNRLEYVLEGLKTYEAIYHSYTPVHTHVAKFQDCSAIGLLEGVRTDPTIWGVKVDGHLLHHAHVSVRKSIYDVFQFDESPEHYRREDSIYGRTLYESGVRIGFLTNSLSNYLLSSS